MINNFREGQIWADHRIPTFLTVSSVEDNGVWFERSWNEYKDENDKLFFVNKDDPLLKELRRVKRVDQEVKDLFEQRHFEVAKVAFQAILMDKELREKIVAREQRMEGESVPASVQRKAFAREAHAYATAFVKEMEVDGV